MPIPSYAVLCYTPGCEKPATYKIAARWSDGVTRELKTYGLACDRCLAAWFRRAQERHRACRRAPGESLDVPGIYRMSPGDRDQRLERLTEVEKDLSSR